MKRWIVLTLLLLSGCAVRGHPNLLYETVILYSDGAVAPIITSQEPVIEGNVLILVREGGGHSFHPIHNIRVVVWTELKPRVSSEGKSN